jgi:hypothetical protein
METRTPTNYAPGGVITLAMLRAATEGMPGDTPLVVDAGLTAVHITDGEGRRVEFVTPAEGGHPKAYV